jgi:uncharacterized membrane protein
MMRKRHRPFYLAVIAAAASCVSAAAVPHLTVWIIASNAFFISYLALTLSRVSKLPAGILRSDPAGNDLPIWAIFLITFGAVAAALVALFIMLNAQNAPGGWVLVLAFCAVPLGWMTIHMMAAIHYAHVYWESGKGLSFPGTKSPGGIEFVYFSFVIGMTAQTSDVAITTSEMRRMNLVHAIGSFFFNTILVAAAVNAAVALGG